MIELVQVSKNHGRTAAVVNVSLTIPRGETLALLGHSGSGKSSLLRLVAGLDFPDAGAVRVEGRLGMVFQSLALWPHVTVRGQLELVLHEERWKAGTPREGATGRSPLHERVDEMLDLFGIRHLADRRPGLLSGGEQQRVALARALAPDPDVLLLDEPLAHLDADNRRLLRERLREQLKGRAVLMATHEEEDARLLANRVARMREGRLE